MNCKQARRLQAGKASRGLRPRDERLLADHLRVCPDCSALENEMERTWDAMACFPSLEPSAGFLSDLKARLRAEPASPGRREWSRRPGLVWQGMALAACLLLFAVLLTRIGPDRRQAVTGPAAHPAADSDRWDEQFLEDLDRTLTRPDADYLAVYDSWPGTAQDHAAPAKGETRPAVRQEHDRREIS